ncbi:MAG TPA: hypothetical protein VIL00_15615 [Pseudonocardiaceae bacterium]
MAEAKSIAAGEWLDLVAPVAPGYGAVSGAVSTVVQAARDVAARGAQAAAPTATFRIRTEDAPRLKVKFEEAIQELLLAQRTAFRLAYIDPPGGDPASAEAVRKLGEKAVADDGSLLMAITRAIEALQSVIDQIDQAIGTYQETDANQMRMA